MGAPSQPGFVLDQSFFGFSGEHRLQLHERLYDLVWAGEGRWDWNTIYNLPIHIRRLWINKINKDREEKSEQHQQQTKSKTDNIPRGPKI